MWHVWTKRVDEICELRLHAHHRLHGSLARLSAVHWLGLPIPRAGCRNMPARFRVHAPSTLSNMIRSRGPLERELSSKTAATAPSCREDDLPLQCAICMEDDEPGALRTGCDHTFHHSCMRSWGYRCIAHGRSFSCPVCRAPLSFDMSGRLETFEQAFIRKVGRASWQATVESSKY